MLSSIIYTQNDHNLGLKGKLRKTKRANAQKQSTGEMKRREKKHTRAYRGQRISIFSLIDGKTVRNVASGNGWGRK